MLEIELKKPNEPKYTVFVPFTKEKYLDRFLTHFDLIQLFDEKTELVFYVDSDSKEIKSKLQEYLLGTKRPFGGLTLVVSGNKEPLEVNTSVKRNRIVDMKEKSKKFISGEYVFCLEDDTIAPPDAFLKMNAIFETDQTIGYIEGVQVGRHGLRMIGAWQTDDLYEPTYQKTIVKGERRFDEITGGGFYCYLTLGSLYRGIKYEWHDECFGPDVCFVMEVRKKGFEAYIDWSIDTLHMTNQGDLKNDEKVTELTWRREKKGWIPQPYRNNG